MTVTPSYAGPVEGAFRLGHVFGSAWDLCIANFPKFVAITFVAALPNLLFFDSTGTPGRVASGWQATGAVLGFVLNMIAQAMILYIAFQSLRGQPASLGDAAQKGLGRVLPLLGTAILFALGAWIVPILAGFLLAVFLFWAIAWIVPILFIVVGFMLTARWFVAIPTCVAERLGPIASLGRSADLTKGHRWKIFGLMLVWFVIMIVIAVLIGTLLVVGGPAVAALGNLLVMAVLATYFNSVWVMVYHDLRVAKDGIDVDQIAAVFD